MNIVTKTVSREQTIHPGNQEICNQFKLPVIRKKISYACYNKL